MPQRPGTSRYIQGEFERLPTVSKEHDQQQVTLLQVAAIKGHDEVVRYLLDHGVNPEIHHYGPAPVYQAVSGDHVSTVKILVERGAKPAGDDPRNNTICVAAPKGNAQMIRLLRSYQVPVLPKCFLDNTDIVGQSPLYMAAVGGYREAVNALLASGAKDIAGLELDTIDQRGTQT